MKTWPLLSCLIFCSSAFAQQPTYQAFEVDSAAELQGGIPFLNTFVQTNLRKPVAVEAQGIGGRVIVSGIVEPNGSVSEVKVASRFRPDCDREAIRVFSLFSAWKPAQKEGKAVRQIVTIPITFPPNEPFIYRNGAVISYFDADNKPVTDSSQARYKQVVPLDSTGLPIGDIIVYKASRKSWAEDSRLPFARKDRAYRDSVGRFVNLIAYQTSIIQWDGLLFGVDEQGVRVRKVYLQRGQRVGTELLYHPNGAVAEKTDDVHDGSMRTSWYPNGQIKQIRTGTTMKISFGSAPDQVKAFWDNKGHQLVKDGNGSVSYQTRTSSRADTNRSTLFAEQGRYENGLKQGVWTGRYVDGSYVYEEQYDKGVCTGGKARTVGTDTVRYTAIEQSPEFKGGMQALGQFLSQELRYPASAQKTGVQGRVFISFVVCTDGTLCDYEVVKGVQPDLDQEAVRVVKRMSGRWKPGVQRGQRVRVKYNLPINFTLN